MMNPELRQKWTAALRSGEYTQGRLTSRSVGEAGEELFCCLGVLAELSGLQRTEDSYCWPAIEQTADQLYGLCHGEWHLIALNDAERLPFSEIADYIDAEAEAGRL